MPISPGESLEFCGTTFEGVANPASSLPFKGSYADWN